MILFFFYKNILFTLPQFYYAFNTKYSRQSIYQDWLISFFNSLFTTFSIGQYSLLEKDIDVKKNEDMLPNVFLYFYGQRNFIFNIYTFIGWIFTGILESIIIFAFIYIIDQTAYLYTGFHESNYELVSTIICTVIIVHIQLKLYLRTYHYNSISFPGYLFFGFIFYFAYIAAASYGSGFFFYYSLSVIWFHPGFWLIVFFMNMSLFLISLMFKQFR